MEAEAAGGLVSLLRAAWLLSTLPIVTAWLPLPGLRRLRTPLLAFAKRGKILQSTSSAAATVPQRFFSHFYAVGILWTTLLLVSVWFYAVNKDGSIDHDDERVWVSVFMLLLMEAQVLRRFYESVKVFNYSPSARMHIIGYFVGIFYYVATPLSLCCTIAPQVLEFMKEKFIIGNYKDDIWKWRTNLQQDVSIWGVLVTPLLRRFSWYVLIGAAIFLWGSLHQLRCHQILGSLRNKPEKMDEYAIPYGDWFEYASSAHYTAEIVIYGGLLVISGGADLTLWLLFAFVVANLGFASSITHKWYKQKFDDYPGNRYAIFPFVY